MNQWVLCEHRQPCHAINHAVGLHRYHAGALPLGASERRTTSGNCSDATKKLEEMTATIPLCASLRLQQSCTTSSWLPEHFDSAQTACELSLPGVSIFHLQECDAKWIPALRRCGMTRWTIPFTGALPIAYLQHAQCATILLVRAEHDVVRDSIDGKLNIDLGDRDALERYALAQRNRPSSTSQVSRLLPFDTYQASFRWQPMPFT